MKSKKAVSLIVLVITVIVMIILASVIIIQLDNSNIIDRANQAVDKTNLKEVQNLAALKWAEAYLEGKGNATEDELRQAVLNAFDEQDIDTTPYDIVVTTSGVSVTAKADVKLVEFTVDNSEVTYKVEEGITWQAWIDSGAEGSEDFSISGEQVFCLGCSIDTGNGPVTPSNIVSDYTRYFSA